MGRRAQGFKVFFRSGYGYVRFTYAQTEHRIALGTTDPREADERARAEFAAVISGRKRAITHAGRAGRSLLGLTELLAEWVSDQQGVLDETTCATLEIYAKHYASFFVSLERITSASSVDYARARLRVVLRKTLLKELSFLRSFLGWCVERGALVDAPAILAPKRTATGKRSGPQRAKPVEITEAQARAILAELPDASKSIGGRRWAIRERFVVAWETGLRPTTLAQLRTPEHYRKGALVLVLEDGDDKARFGRTLPLSPAARAALDASLPDEPGLIFGAHRFDKVLKAAAAKVLGPHEAKNFAAYDFRHGMGTHLVDEGAPLTGVAFLLGHKRLSTTDRYAKPNRRAAERALAVSGIAAQYPPKGAVGGNGDGKKLSLFKGDRRGLNPRHLEPQRSEYDVSIGNSSQPLGRTGPENDGYGPCIRPMGGNPIGYQGVRVEADGADPVRVAMLPGDTVERFADRVRGVVDAIRETGS